MPNRVTVDETRLLIEETNDALILTGVSIQLAQRDVPANLHLIVRAYEVSLIESLRLPSRNVEIYCRHLRVAANAAIDVSGEAGEDRALPAPSGRAAGEGGANGATGGNGANSGNIRVVAETLTDALTCRANGGRGGRGQDGGNGAEGAVGADGRDGELRHNGFVGEPGNPGGRGGNAGRGGDGGNGGAAGTVELRFLRRPTTQITVEALGGDGAYAGLNGRPGSGGPGGRGGQQTSCTWEPHEPVRP
jgi:hypothetical protein